MQVLDFYLLNARQENALVVAMLVRNTLEDFHIAHLTDLQIKELNQLIRYSIYNAFELMETMTDDPAKEFFFDYLVRLIPDYWEIPGRDPNPNVRVAA